MGGMPYHLEKGPVFATMEALYEDPEELSAFLLRLWREGAAALGSLGALTSQMWDDRSNPQSSNATDVKRITSLRRDWFGDHDGQPQPAFGDPLPASGLPAYATGYWKHYYGRVRDIVAETMARAAEVALGVDRPAELPETAPAGTRHWPVEFFWKCGQPRFEGWVTWRDQQTGRSGQVTVIFATPATPDQVLGRPGDEADEVPPPGWKQQWQGMWVCSHADHKQHLIVTVAPTTEANWFVPVDAVMFTEGTGDVGSWAPKFGSGGAAPTLKAFQHGSEQL